VGILEVSIPPYRRTSGGLHEPIDSDDNASG
jgi:hypothetical protein